MHLRTAEQRVQVARALEQLPETSRAMAEGRISYSQARILAREATAECEGELLEVAEHATVAEPGTRERLDRRAPERRRLDAATRRIQYPLDRRRAGPVANTERG